MVRRYPTTILAGAVLAAVASAARAEPVTDLTYHLTVCGADAVTCRVDPAPLGSVAPAGLSEASLRAFLAGYGAAPDVSVSYDLVGVNANGYAYGRLYSDYFGAGAASFVAGDSGVFCCAFDAVDLTLAGVNDRNLAIVNLPSIGAPWLAYLPDFDRSGFPTLDAASLDALRGLAAPGVDPYATFNGATFDAIDDADRVGGFSFNPALGYFLLEPVVNAPAAGAASAVAAVPEPGALALLLTALALGAGRLTLRAA